MTKAEADAMTKAEAKELERAIKRDLNTQEDIREALAPGLIYGLNNKGKQQESRKHPHST